MSHLERDTRQCIVDTAERFFRDIGYQKTTVADIAKALRMSPANVYRFFDSKKSINEAVAERYMGEMEAAVTAIAREKRSAAERLRDILITNNRINSLRYLDHHKVHEMVAAAMEESWEVVQAHIGRYDGILRGVVAEGIASGEFRPMDPQVATACVRFAMTPFCHPMLISQCLSLPGPSIEAMVDFILAGLGYSRAKVSHAEA
ncbi:TetR/AcrR family transcriptional regulator [Bosea sp. 2RAB26]|uniref:TetR/AcrR family transcriptional regulator n=1 Tax=Bosea sp. 2RAB26 TaxID=3237476 RepID=UPI003F92965B